jgi:hypothetical protein
MRLVGQQMELIENEERSKKNVPEQKRNPVPHKKLPRRNA